MPKLNDVDVESSDNSTHTVRVFRKGQLIKIVPPIEGLAEAIETISHEAQTSKKHGFHIRRIPSPLVWAGSESSELPNSRNYQWAFAGLEAYIPYEANKLGLEIEFTGSRPAQLKKPDWAAIGGKTGDRNLLRFVQHEERGLIRYCSKKVDIAWCIAQIALAWPQERIVVVATRQHDAEDLAKKVRRRVPEVSLATTKHHPAKAKRVAIVTQSHLRQIGVDARRRTIMISINPTEVLNNTPMLHAEEWLPKMRCRLFGLLPDHVQVAPRTNDLMSALFGPRRLYIPRHGRHDLPVEVVSLSVHGGGRALRDLRDSSDAFEVKRQLVWNHGIRNRRIAQLARDVNNEDHKALAKGFPELQKPLCRRLGQRIGVLVENMEHAAQLLTRLSGWPIVADQAALKQPLNEKVQEAVKAGVNPSRGQTEDVIVTTNGLKAAGRFDVLIRADAGTSLPLLPERHLTATDGMSDSLLIVDVNDSYHPLLRRRSRWRRQAYVARGWVVDGLGAEGTQDERRNDERRDGQSFRIGYLSTRRKKREGESESPSNHITLKRISNPELLQQCFKSLRSGGGQGAGLDGVSYCDLSPSETGSVLRKLSKDVRCGRYRPQVARAVPIPKPGTSEKRVLRIGSTCDRTLARAADVVLKPHFDKLFVEQSYGFRPQRSVWNMIADLKQTIEETGRWVLAIDDVRKAFDNVSIEKLMHSMQRAKQDLRRLKNSVKINDSVFELLAVMAKGADVKRTIGIDQGHNISPLALNVLLHYVHDLPLNAEINFPFWYRYADNLVYLCQSVSEGQEMLDRVGEILCQSRLKLKGKDGVIDLREEPAQLLGFRVRKNTGRLQVSLGNNAWNALNDNLRDAHDAKDPNRVAVNVIAGWVNALGPAFENGEPIAAKVLKTAKRFGFQEISLEWIEKLVKGAWERWRRMLCK